MSNTLFYDSIKKKYIPQESNSIILWNKPQIKKKEYFSHDIPPAPPQQIKWNYPEDPPIIRSKHMKLIENHSTTNINNNINSNNNNNSQRNEDINGKIEIKNKRPQSANIMISSRITPTSSRSTSNFHLDSNNNDISNNNNNTSRIKQNNEILSPKITGRPVSAPKSRITSSRDYNNDNNNNMNYTGPKISSREAFGIAFHNQQNNNTTTTSIISNEKKKVPPLTSLHNNQQNNNNNNKNYLDEFDFNMNTNMNMNNTLKQSSSQTSNINLKSNNESKIPKKSSKDLIFPSKEQFRKKKKSYFDFKKLPKDLFQSTNSYLTNESTIINKTSTMPSSSSSSSSSKVLNDNNSNNNNNHGRSEETARIHYLIDDLMMKLSQVQTKKERHKIKAEFTHVISKFAQQQSKGGDY